MKINIPYTRFRASLLLIILLFLFVPNVQMSAQIIVDSGEIKEILLDNLGNLYEIEEGHTLKKYSSEGIMLFEYSHADYANIMQIDVKDPYKIALFYEDQQKVILLDKTLSPLSEIDLSGLENKYIDLVQRSEDGLFWMYDVNGQQLLKVDDELQIQLESFPMYQEGIDDFSPDFMDVDLNRILLGDRNKGVLIYDHLGNYLSRIKTGSYMAVRSVGKDILLYNQQGIYTISSFDFQKYSLFDFNKSSPLLFTVDKSHKKLFGIKRNGEKLDVFMVQKL